MVIAIVEGLGEPWIKSFPDQLEAERGVTKYINQFPPNDRTYDVSYYDDYGSIPPEFQGLLKKSP